MTGWHLSQGYCSVKPAIPWNAWARRMVEETIPARLADVKALCLMAGLTEAGDGNESLDDFLCRYADRTDATISLVDEADSHNRTDDLKQIQVMQLASGWGRSRDVKEKVRAAVVAFFVLEGIKHGHTINVTVC